jgi:hypothetical protein
MNFRRKKSFSRKKKGGADRRKQQPQIFNIEKTAFDAEK